MILSLSGNAGAGKNTVASIIQYLLWKQKLESGDAAQSIHTTLDFFLRKAKVEGQRLSGWKQVAFAGKLKQIASILTGVPVEKFEDQEFKKQEMPEQWDYKPALKTSNERTPMTYRIFLQTLGSECLRSIHPDIHVNGLFADYVPEYKHPPAHQDYLPIVEKYPRWLITDTRFVNEFQAVKQRDGLCIRIIRPGVEQGNHASETGLKLIPDDQWDYTLINDNSIEVLVQRVETMLKYLKIIE